MKRVKNILTYIGACLFIAGLQLRFSSVAYAQGEGLVPDAVEHAALVDFYNSLDGPNWTNNTNWLVGNTSADFATWHGITVINGDVTKIDLNENQLVGTIPAKLEDLTSLSRLYLNGNQLSVLPPEIGNLPSLIELYLSGNQLSALPPEIGNLTSLTHLYLSDNQLSALPPEIGNLTSLNFFRLDHNQLSTLPPEIGNLTSLKWLLVRYNQLTSLPSQIGNLTSLTSLALDNNQLSVLPPEIGNLTNLPSLALENNQLSTLLPEIGNLTSLTNLALDNNQLSTLPPEIGNLTSLTWMRIRNNQLTTLPPQIGNLTNLNQLYLDVNQLNTLPPEIGNLTSLTLLNIRVNQLSALPREIGGLASLTNLILNNNQLSELPPEIGNLTNLSQLYLSSNNLVKVPSEIGNLTNLVDLRLHNNQLTSIPSELGNLTNLSILFLRHNQLVAIPSEVGNLTSLTELYLSSNLLSTVPPEIGNLTSLTELYLDNNQLSTIPSEIGNLSGLTQLTLGRNQLNTIPSEIGNLTNLELLYLDFNQLNSFPQNISNLSNLRYLRVYQNRFLFNDIELFTSGPDVFTVENFDFLPQQDPVRSKTNEVLIGQPLTMIAEDDAVHNSYQWQKQNGALWENLPNQNNRQLQLANVQQTDLGNYRCEITNSWITTLTLYENFELLSAGDPLPNLPLQNFNYITAYEIIREGVNSETMINNLPDKYINKSVEYFDGLGRSIQSVIVQGSPDKNDMVAPVKYDVFGRLVYDYLPYVLKDTDTSNGSYRPNALKGATGYTDSEQYLFYQNTGEIADDTAPFARKKFEASPLNRITEQGAPGQPWQPHPTNESGKTIKFRYHTNIANQVRLWELDAVTSLPKTTSRYGPKELIFNETEDEEGAETHEFVDQLGRTILKEVQNVISSTQVEWLRTYYVYDDFNNLRYVFPPKATNELGDGNFVPTSADHPVLKNLVFQYKYDERQRMIMKKVPGAEPVYMVYDQFDRLVFTQDGNQFEDSEWSFTKYDHLNRPVLTGTMVLANTWGTDRMAYRDDIEAGLDTYYLNELAMDPNHRYESYSAAATWGYTDRSYPQLTLGSHKILTVTFYDNHDFIAHGRLGTTSVDYSFEPELGLLAGDAFGNLKGLVTGSRTKVLGEDKYLNMVSYYDDRYRVIQTIADNYTGGFDRVTSEYDFAGRALRTKQTHHRGTGNFVNLVVNQSFTYDHASRLINTYHRINNQDSVLLTANRYNEIGELIEKNLHSTDVASPQYKQSVDYRYNIRGWLTHINNSALTGDGLNALDQAPDYFGMELYYNEEVPGLNYDMTGNLQDPLNRPSQYFQQMLQGLPVKPIISYQKPTILSPAPLPVQGLVPVNVKKTNWGKKFGVDYRVVNPGKIKAKISSDKKPGIGLHDPKQIPDRTTNKTIGSKHGTTGSSEIAYTDSEDTTESDEEDSTEWTTYITPEVFLNVDPNTLTASLDGTLWVSEDFTATAACHEDAGMSGSVLAEELWLEAECGTVGANWTTTLDASASGNNYVVMASGTGQNSSAPTSANDHVSFTFDITTTGIYKVWGRVLAANSGNDSFWIRMDGGNWIKWNSIPSGSWLWDDVHDSDNANIAVTFNLTAGSHTLDVAFREIGAKLDKLYVSDTGTTPTGMGGSATNCGTPGLPSNPTGLTVDRTSFNYVKLLWNPNAQPVDDYTIERSLDNTNFTVIGTTAGSELSYRDNTTQAATSYYYRIRANNSVGSSDFTASVNAVTIGMPGVMTDQLQLYLDVQNPASYPGSGNTWYDLSTHANDATLAAYSFDGTDLSFAYNGTQVITSESLPIAQNQAFSVGFWINPSDNSRPNTVRSSFSLGAFIFGVRSGYPGSIQAGIHNTDENAMIARTDLPAGLLANNQDQYFVYTYENNIATLYKNGEFLISKDIGPMTTAWGKFILSYALGKFNAAQVYSKALTADEVWHNYFMGYGQTSSTVTIPATPTGLNTTALSVSQLSLTWIDEATNEVYYLVERSTDGISFAPVKYLPAGSTAYEDQGLNAATSYTYRVKAVNSAGSSAASASQTVVTDGLPAINIASDALELYLDAGNASSYNGAGTGTVWSDISGKNSHATLDNGVTKLSGHLRFNDQGFFAPLPALTAGTSNFSIGFWMRPTEAGYRYNNLHATSSEYGIRSFFSRNDATNLRYITGVTTTNMYDNYSTYILNEWAYFVFTYENGAARMYKNGVEYVNSPQTQDPVTLNFEGLALKQGYGDFDILQVYSKTLSSQEVFQNYEIHKNRYFVPTQVPAAPTGLAINSTTSGEIKITWTDNADNEDKFVVEVADDQSGPFGVLDEVIVNVNNYTHQGLTPNRILYYRVKADNHLGSSAYSNVISAKTLSTSASPPATPTGLSASVQSYSRISLTWNDVATHEDEYQVERSTNGTNYSLLATLPFNASAYEDSGLDPSTTYYYRVAALNTAGSSAYSNEVNSTTTSLPDFSVVTSGMELYLDATLTMSYDGSGPTWFDLSGSGNDATLDAGVVKENGRLHFTDQGFEAPLPGLLAGTTNFSVGFWMRPDAQGYAFNNVSSINAAHLVGAYYAFNEGGTRMVTGVLENRFGPLNIYQLNTWVYMVYTYDNGTGRLYRNGTLRDGPASQGPVQVDFEKMIFSKGHGDFEVLQVYNRTLSDAEVLQNYNADKDRYSSTTAAPAAPTGMVAAVASKSQINLSWTDNATDEGNYVVEYSTDGGVSYQTLVSLPSASFAYEHAGLSPGQTVYYRVVATNSTGSSSYSNIVSAATLLEEPAGLSASPYLSTRIDLSWVDNAQNETGYEIERKLATEGTYTLVHTTAANVSTYADEGLPSETAYNYRVRAVNGANYSVYSNEVTVTTGLTPPTGLAVSGISSSEIDVSWQDNTAAETGYVLERSLSSGGGFAEVANLAANVTMYRDDNLLAETTYFYRVRAIDATSGSAYSNVAGASTLPLVFSNPDLQYKAKPYFNGNISAVTWQTYNSGQEQGYTYVYDQVNRIKSASHVYATGVNTWNMNDARFSVGNIMYDHNGNIKSLKRQARNLEGVYVIDDLEYTYESGEVSNLLQSVNDGSGIEEGFKDGNTSATDYSYDANGNLESDANKDITTIEYNILNLPQRIVFANGNEILYTYDAAGMKLRKEVQENVDGTVVKTVTDYMSGVQYTINDYQGAGESISRDFVMTPEGRATSEVGEAPSTAYNYEYNLTDHLGNVRVTFTTKEEQPDEYLATFETNEQPTEALDFQNYGDAFIVPSIDYNHTQQAGSDKSVRLSGSASEIIGLAKSLAVVPGDVIDMEVYVKYLAGPGGTDLGGIFSIIAEAFGVSGTSTGEGLQAYNAISGLMSIPSYAAFANEKASNEHQVFLNYLLFDKDFILEDAGYVPMEGTANAVPDPASVAHEYMSASVTVEKPGYIYIYLSNESGQIVETFFDDFKITHTKSPIISADDYYPFGLAIRQNSYQRESAADQRYKYNGVELNDVTGNYEMAFRGYDPALGRFMQIDPLADFIPGISPFNFAYNNPINFNDPDGLIGMPGKEERKRRRRIRKLRKRNERKARKRNRRQARKRWQETRPWAKGIKDTRPDNIDRLGGFGADTDATKPTTSRQVSKVPVPEPIKDIVKEIEPEIPSYLDTPLPTGQIVKFDLRIPFVANSDRPNVDRHGTTFQHVVELVELLKQNPAIQVTLIGNVGFKNPPVTGGSKEALSLPALLNGKQVPAGKMMEARVSAIKRILVSQGINPDQILTKKGKVFKGRKGVSINIEILNNR